jgi:hypothetical protein
MKKTILISVPLLLLGLLFIRTPGWSATGVVGGPTVNQLQAGSFATAANTTYSNAFAAAFSSAPIVVASVVDTSGSNILTVSSITTSNFTWTANVTNLTINWIAIGKSRNTGTLIIQ